MDAALYLFRNHDWPAESIISIDTAIAGCQKYEKVLTNRRKICRQWGRKQWRNIEPVLQSLCFVFINVHVLCDIERVLLEALTSKEREVIFINDISRCELLLDVEHLADRCISIQERRSRIVRVHCSSVVIHDAVSQRCCHDFLEDLDIATLPRFFGNMNLWQDIQL